MRKLVTALAATALVAAPTAGAAAAAGSTPASRAQLGEFSSPFREDGDNGTTSSCAIDPSGKKTCLPAGASQNVLPDGRILYWNAIEGSEDVAGPVATEGHRRAGDARSRLLTFGATNTWKTPANETGFFGNTAEKPLVEGTKVEQNGDTLNNGSLFCADNTFLPNGNVLTVGGTDYYAEPGLPAGGQPSVGVLELEGLKSARSFTAKGDTWQPEGSMTYGRWYPSLTTLADGTVLASSGVTKLLKPAYAPDDRYDLKDSGRNVAQSEVFDPAASTWTVNPETADRSLPLFPRMHLLPNGHVYYDAAGQAFNPAGQGYDEALWNTAASYDPVAKTWTDLGIPGLTTEGGPKRDPGFRGSTFSQMLTLKAPYATASFLSAGGVVGTSPGSYLPVDSARINRWVADGFDGKAGPRLQTFDAGKLAGSRWYGSGVTLPDGSVIVLSGGDLDHVIAPGSEAPITRVERFTPNAAGTGGTWETLAEAKQGRTYHNAATLLPDGRVLVGGHDPIPTYYGPQNQAISRSKAEPDASFEIFSPPYLFAKNGDTAIRPIISADNEVHLGKQLTLGTSGANDIAKVVLVRNPSVTHLIDGDQRNVEIPFTQSGNSVRAMVPDNAAVLPAGPYLLFAINAAGTPSVAEQVSVVDAGTATAKAVTSAGTSDPKPAKAQNAAKPNTPSKAGDAPAAATSKAKPAVALDRAQDGGGAVDLAAVPASNRREIPEPVLPVAAAIAGVALALVIRRGRGAVVEARRR